MYTSNNNIMNTNKTHSFEEERIKALQQKPGAAIEEPEQLPDANIEEPMSVEDIQDTVDLINPDDNSMNSRG